MITDRQITFSRAQAVTTGTQYSDSYDTGRGSGASIGDGEPLTLVVNVGVAFAGGTNLTVNYVQSANANLSSPDVLASSGAVVEANLTAGKNVLRIGIPPNTKRYVGLQFVSSGTHTNGTIDAVVVFDTDTNRIYPYETGR